jgi:carboxyl-terminal processing protease
MLIGMLAGGLLTWTLGAVFERPSLADAPSDAGGRKKQDSIEDMLEDSGLSRTQLQKILSAYRLVTQRFYRDTDQETLIDGAVRGMLEALDDPYSEYMSAEEAERFEKAVIEPSFSGIGAEVTLEDGKVMVVAPIKGSPADRAGIRAKDIILSVNGESLEGLTLNEAVMKIRGPKGTTAKLLIQRGEQAKPVEIVVVRDEIDYETVYARMEDDKIGVIEVRQFANNTAERFLEELRDLERQGMRGLIIDVRNNPGGVLSTVLQMAEPFVPQGEPLVYVENREGRREPYVSETGTGKNYPVAVLVNGGSASASEILAAVIQESGAGIVVGEKTFGKGTVQSTFDSGAGDGSSVKLTIARWLTPKGNSINETGVQPDIVVSLPEYYQVMPMSKSKTLKREDLDTDVQHLQTMLNGLGYETGRKDGYFSVQTEEAVRRFQQDHELPVTGQVDVKTAEAIEQALIAKMLDPANDSQFQRALQEVRERANEQTAAGMQ